MHTCIYTQCKRHQKDSTSDIFRQTRSLSLLKNRYLSVLLSMLLFACESTCLCCLLLHLPPVCVEFTLEEVLLLFDSNRWLQGILATRTAPNIRNICGGCLELFSLFIEHVVTSNLSCSLYISKSPIGFTLQRRTWAQVLYASFPQ